jgi:hypothetical protein
MQDHGQTIRGPWSAQLLVSTRWQQPCLQRLALCAMPVLSALPALRGTRILERPRVGVAPRPVCQAASLLAVLPAASPLLRYVLLLLPLAAPPPLVSAVLLPSPLEALLPVYLPLAASPQLVWGVSSSSGARAALGSQRGGHRGRPRRGQGPPPRGPSALLLSAGPAVPPPSMAARALPHLLEGRPLGRRRLSLVASH